MNESNGLSTNTPNRLEFGPGQFVINYGVAGTQAIGATRDGGMYDPGVKYRTIKSDAPNGPDNVKGMIRLAEVKPIITVKALEMSSANLQKILGPYAKTVSAPYDELRVREIASTDYFTNVTVLTTKSGSSDPTIYQIFNALAMPDSIKFTWKNQDEIVLDCTFQGFWDPAALTTPPSLIRTPTVI
jgi:hypothetical protein